MHRLWSSLIEPALSQLEREVIVEIGSGSGQNTKNLLEFCRAHGTVLHAIDPLPQFDVPAWLREYRDHFVFHRAKSLDALLKLGHAEAFLIDGDHNWYTVFHELLLIQNLARQNSCPFPLVMLHDIDWPYGRRDLYYNPEDIPAPYRKPSQKKGMIPRVSELQDSGGMNPNLNNAVSENGSQNGVLTAVEDFMKDAREELEFIKLEGFHGLGILIPAALESTNSSLYTFLREAAPNQPLTTHIRALENNRILSELTAQKKEQEIEKALCQLTEMQVGKTELEAVVQRHAARDSAVQHQLQEMILAREKMKAEFEAGAQAHIERESQLQRQLRETIEAREKMKAEFEVDAQVHIERESQLQRQLQETIEAHEKMKAEFEAGAQMRIERESQLQHQLGASIRSQEEFKVELEATRSKLADSEHARRAESAATARAQQERESELQLQLHEALQGQERLKAELESTFRRLAELERARQADSEVASHLLAYQKLISRIRELVGSVLPQKATVIVLSKGDEELLKLQGRKAWHFPQTEDGIYAGCYPADASAAILHLEMLRAKGGEFLLFPKTAFWWLDYYREFQHHLDTHYPRLWNDESCIIFKVAKSWWSRSWLKSFGLRSRPPSPEPALSVSIETRHPDSEHASETLSAPLAQNEDLAPAKVFRPAPRNMPVPASHLRFALEHAETLPLSPPTTKFDPSRMNLHWVIPDFAPGMGGHMAIFRMISLLESFGHENTIWIRGGTQYGTADDARRVIQEQIIPLEARVRLLIDNIDEVHGDAVIATHCWTAYSVRAITRVRERFYFVQDFEPSFYSMGSEYLLAEATYRFGFMCIASGKWLQNLLESRYQCKAAHFVYGYDPTIYHNDPGECRSENRIAFYGRSVTPRRAVELGLFALELAAKRCPDLVVDFFGGRMGEMNVPYSYCDHGLLSHHELARLYRQTTIGLVFSTTNYSLIPREMMACGLPVIDLEGESSAAEYPNDVITLSEPTPEAIASNIEGLLKNRERRNEQAFRAKRYVERFTWETSARQVEAALRNGILARRSNERELTDEQASNPAYLRAQEFEPLSSNCLAVTTTTHELPCSGSGVPAESTWERSFTGPVVFVGQPEYYRSSHYDLTSTGRHFEFPITSADWSVLRALPRFVLERGARTCIVFRPEWFAPYRDAFDQLKSQGVAVIGYSSEPVPHTWKDAHPDQCKRLDSLKRALDLDYDLIIHFDPCSIEFLGIQGFSRIIGHPLPVSRKLFFPENRSREFDVCFLGKSTPHREEMLLPLKMRFNTVHVAHGLCDAEARILMNRSKMVLNIHNEPYLNFENRVVQALFCRRPVLSELLCGNLLLPGEDYILFDSPRDLCQKVTALLQANAWTARDNDLSRFTIYALMARLGIKDVQEVPGARIQASER